VSLRLPQAHSGVTRVTPIDGYQGAPCIVTMLDADTARELQLAQANRRRASALRLTAIRSFVAIAEYTATSISGFFPA
jgi:hypothetical protein